MKILIVALVFVVAGLLAHFVADSRGRPSWEPWVITGVAAVLSAACYLLFPSPLFVIALAPLPAGAMFLFPQRRLDGEPLIAACPHCREALHRRPAFRRQASDLSALPAVVFGAACAGSHV